MKKKMIRALTLLLTAAMMLPLASCAKTEEPAGTTASGSESAGTTVTEAVETERQPFVERKNYGKECHVLYCPDMFKKPYYFITDEADRKPGNDLDDKLFERMNHIEEYLGVKIVPIDAGEQHGYYEKLSKTTASGDDAYQIVMSHVYFDVATLIADNYLRDFKSFNNLNLDGDYWNTQLMEELSVNGHYFCGHNDFLLASCDVITFNKDMLNEYGSTVGSLYDDVRNRKWTLDRMIEVSQLVAEDNGDGKWDVEDTYGMAGYAWTSMIGFQTGADIPLVKRDPETSCLYVSPMKDNKEKMVDLMGKMFDFEAMDCTYMYHHTVPESKRLYLDSGRVLLEMTGLYKMLEYKGGDVRFGVLPYPLYDENQEQYKTLSWGGTLMIPGTVKDDAMVGDTIEMLAFFSEPVRYSFYENLLGAKLAEAPEDSEMLDLIWDTQTSDAGLVYSFVSGSMDRLLYAIPMLIHDKKRDCTAYYRANGKVADRALKEFFEKVP